MVVFTELEQITLKCVGRHKCSPPPNEQSSEGKTGIKLFNFRLYYQCKATVIKIVWYCRERNRWVNGAEWRAQK